MTPGEIQRDIGARLRSFRLDRRLPQAELASRAGVSLRALQHIEAGAGSTLETFIRVLKALGYLSMFDDIAPANLVQPMNLLRRRKPRLRAPRQRIAKARS